MGHFRDFYYNTSPGVLGFFYFTYKPLTAEQLARFTGYIKIMEERTGVIH